MVNALPHVGSFLSQTHVEKLRNGTSSRLRSYRRKSSVSPDFLSVSHVSASFWRKNTASHLTSNAGQVEFSSLKGGRVTRLRNPLSESQCSNTHSHAVRRVKLEMTVKHEKPTCTRASCSSELDPDNKSLQHSVQHLTLTFDLHLELKVVLSALILF